jgi:hypothetical protein
MSLRPNQPLRAQLRHEPLAVVPLFHFLILSCTQNHSLTATEIFPRHSQSRYFAAPA